MTFNLRATAAHCSRHVTGKPVIGLKAFALPVLTAAAVVGGITVMTAPAFAETYVVKLGTDKGLLQFERKTLTIKPGDTVVWTVNKHSPHNVVFDPLKNPLRNADLAKSLSHPRMMYSPGQTVETVFPADAPAGKYSFSSTPHAGVGMVGTIIVAP